MLGLIGKKIGMTKIFAEDGQAIPVTVIEVGPCQVMQIKTLKRDGYNALQLGFGQGKEKQKSKAFRNHAAKSGDYLPSALAEFRLDEVSQYELGQEIRVEIFAEGDAVHVRGTSKGRGFTGVIKRHGFSGGDETHGNRSHRVPGSIGASAYPGRVWKGKKMPGQHGNSVHKVKNLKVTRIDGEKNYLFVKGAVPGPNMALVTVFKSN